MVKKIMTVHVFTDPPFPKAPKASRITHKVTPVASHVFSVDFPQEFQSWEAVDPAELFHAPISNQERQRRLHHQIHSGTRGLMMTTKCFYSHGRASGWRYLVTLALAFTCFTSAFSASPAATPQVRSSSQVPKSPLSSLHRRDHSPQLISSSHRHDQSSASVTTSWSSTMLLSQREATPPQPDPKVEHVVMMSASASEDSTDEESSPADGLPTSRSSSMPATRSMPSIISIAIDNSRRNRRIQIAAACISALAGLSIAAHDGLLRGPPLAGGGGFGPYTDAMILRDVASTALTAVLAVVFVRAVTYGYEQGWYSSKVGRKLNHTLAAPLFILFFPLFSPADGARLFAGLVTTTNILRLYLAGTGSGETSLAKTVSRSGDKAEVLGGPFIYVCIFQLCIWFFWRTSPVGVVAMSTMAAGDGMADLIGRRWGERSPWSFASDNKSMVGTLAFALSAFACSFGLLNWLAATGCLELSLGTMDLAGHVLLISIVCAFVELVPVGDDNFTVPLTAAALAALLLQ